MIQYIIGGTGSGKSYSAYMKIIREAEKNPKKRYFVIVPEQFTLQTQREIVLMTKAKGIMNIDVLSFMRLAYRVFDELDIKERMILEDTGKSMIIRKLINKLSPSFKYFKRAAGKQGFTEEMKSALSEFMQYDISPESLKELENKSGENRLGSVLTAKLSDTALIYEAFNNYKKDKYIAAEQVLDELCKVMGGSNMFNDSVLCFDGFTGFTPLQLKAVEILLKKAEQVIVTLTMDDKAYYDKRTESFGLFNLSNKTLKKLNEVAVRAGTGIAEPFITDYKAKAEALLHLEKNIFRYNYSERKDDTDNTVSIISCKNPKNEVNIVLERILHLVRDEGKRYRDIAVVIGDMEEYGRLAFDILTKGGVPCFLDSKKNIMDNPFVEFIRAGLAVTDENFSYEAVMRYLRSGFSGITGEEADIFENYILARGIKGEKRYKDSFLTGDEKEDDKDIFTADKVREEIVKKFTPLKEAFREKERNTASVTAALYNFIRTHDCEKRLYEYSVCFENKGRRVLAREYASCFKLVMDVLEKMYDLLGDEKLSLNDYVKILEAGLSEAKAGFIPSGLDRVVIGDIERTRLTDIKMLFCLGFNEGVVPKGRSLRGIITDREKEKLKAFNIELAPTAKEKAFSDQFYIYMTLSKPTERLFVSYSMNSSNGKALKPSYIIERIRGLYKEKRNITLKSENMAEILIREVRRDGGISYILAAARKDLLKDKSLIGLIKYYNKNKTTGYEKLIEGINSEAVTSKVKAKVLNELYGELKGSITRLEAYSACAFAHFMEYGLRLKERKQYKLMAFDVGNIFHDVLERFSKKLISSGESFHTISEEKRAAICEESVNEAVGYGNDILLSTSRLKYMINRIKRLSHRATWAITEQVKRGEFEPFLFEEAFIFEGMRGRIDRIDSFVSDFLPDGTKLKDNKDEALKKYKKAEYVRVIDYKTGNKRFEADRLYYGLDLQLPVYLEHVSRLIEDMRGHEKNLIIPSGSFYFHIDDPVIEKGDTDNAFLKALRFDGFSSDGTYQVSLADKGVVSGEAANGNLNLVIGAESSVLNLSVSKKEKVFNKNSVLYSKKGIEGFIKHSGEKIKEIKANIMKEEIRPYPYELNGKNGCEYCDYKSICGFDRRVDGYEFNRLKKLEPAEILLKIEEMYDKN